MSKGRRPYIGPSESQSKANAEALDRRSRTYADENAASWHFAQDRVANRPVGLRALVRWAQREFRLEPPPRLHDENVADDGAPDMTGQARAYLGMSHGQLGGLLLEDDAQATDWVSVACQRDEDGNYQTPLRCTIARIGTKQPKGARLLRVVVQEFAAWDRVLAEMGVDPEFTDYVIGGLLGDLYDRYSAMPRPRRTKSAQEVAAA